MKVNMMRNRTKVWSIGIICICSICLLVSAMVICVIDPYFHYHKPIDGIAYVINDARYQNDGIVRNFEYDAIITGTSTTQQFKSSELDDLFGVNSVKVSYSGGSHKEINDNLKRALESNSEIKLIVRGFDYYRLLDEKDVMRYSDYPTYLYDNRIFNDVSYVLNKYVLLDAIDIVKRTQNGSETTTFDQYGRFEDNYQWGKAAVDATYIRAEKCDREYTLSEEDKNNIEENIKYNVIDLVAENPDIEFYFFYTPHSIYLFDNYSQNGLLTRYLQAEEYTTKLLLECDNVHLFSFFDEYDMICDLNNYKDVNHYSERINSQILVWMKDGSHELTKDNYKQYYSQITDFYTSYDYDALFE